MCQQGQGGLPALARPVDKHHRRVRQGLDEGAFGVAWVRRSFGHRPMVSMRHD